MPGISNKNKHISSPGEETQESLREGKARIVESLKPLTLVVGHYGVGKTNLALNLALDSAAAGYDTTLVDLDIVNPYFRSTEYRRVLEEAGVRVIAPVFSEAGSSLDVPSLTGAIAPAIQAIQRPSNNQQRLILDVGGDDEGAKALGRFTSRIAECDYDMLYVVNPRRNLTQTLDEARELMEAIEARCGLSVTAIVGNAHLQEFTDEDVIEQGRTFAEAFARITNKPLICYTVPISLVGQKDSGLCPALGPEHAYPVARVVKTTWE